MARKRKTAKAKVDLARQERPGTAPVDVLPEYRADGVEGALLHQFRERVFDSWRYWYNQVYSATRDDLRLTYESLWLDEEKAARLSQNKPALEINHLPQYVNQIYGSLLQSKFSIHVGEQSDGGYKGLSAGGRVVPLCEIMEGMIRQIEHESDAPRRYARGGQHAIEGSVGWLFVRTFVPAGDPFKLCLRVEQIADRFSVYYDPSAMDDQLMDAKWCVMSVPMTKREFEVRYPKSTPPMGMTNFGLEDTRFNNWWGEDGSVRVNDYYYKQAVTADALQMKHPSSDALVVVFPELEEERYKELVGYGFQEVDRRSDVSTERVMYMRCTDTEILDGPHFWPSEHLPIVPVFGRRVDGVTGGRKLLSATRYAADPARMMTIWMSAVTERVANSPKAPWIVTEKQISRHKKYWDEQVYKSTPYLPYDHDDEAPPPTRVPGATMPHGEMMVLQAAENSLRSAVGLHQSNLGEVSNETSGVAIERRQRPGATAMFEFQDNVAAAVRHVGIILCDMIPRIYTTDDFVRIMSEDGKESSVRLNMKHEVEDVEGNKRVYLLNALGMSKYTCSVTAGPTYSSQKEELFGRLLEMTKHVGPEVSRLFMDKIFESSDWPNARQIAKRIRHTVPFNMLTDEEKEEIGEQQPTPDQQVEQMKAQADIAKAEGQTRVAQLQTKITEMQAEIADMNVKEEEVKLATAQANAGKADIDMERDERERAGGGGEDDIRKVVKQVMADEMAAKRK